MTTAHEHNTSPFPPANRKRSSPTMKADFLRHLAVMAEWVYYSAMTSLRRMRAHIFRNTSGKKIWTGILRAYLTTPASIS